MYKLALFTVIVVVCTAFPSFRGRIPNGDKVPNPCPSGGIWEAVGHFNSSGGGDTNPFGDDFASAGYVWTQGLCKLDSDLDGKSNGAELGDPNCTWHIGSTDPLGQPTGNPGICEPFTAAACKTQIDVCAA